MTNRNRPRRDDEGRFKADRRSRNLAIGAVTAASAVAGAIGAALHFGWFDRFFPSPGKGGEHQAPDLALDKPRPGPEDRAPDAFRPDPTAPVPADMRESLRPATGASPSLVADRGELRSGTAPLNG